MTVSEPLGIETVMSLRLCSRAPETTNWSISASPGEDGRTERALGRMDGKDAGTKV
jgi:hypothetical protein